MTTTWTSPSAGQCRSGPAPVFETPRLLSEPPRRASGAGPVDSFARSLRGCRGVQTAASTPFETRPTRARCFRCCKLRASRVPTSQCDRRVRPGFIPSTALQRTPTSPETVVLVPRCPSATSLISVLLDFPGGADSSEWCAGLVRESGNPGMSFSFVASVPCVALPCFSGGPPLRRGRSARGVPHRGDTRRAPGEQRATHGHTRG